MHPSCQTCGKQFEPVGGDPARLPLVLDCMCVFCRGCAVQHEAEHLSSTDSKEGAKMWGIPCLRCKKLRTTPLTDLLPSLPNIDAAVAEAARSSKPVPTPAPACDICEGDEATRYCGDCLKITFFCDGCFASSHKFAKKKSHTSIPIHEHLQQSIELVPGAGKPAGPPMCKTHPDHPCGVFCNTCGTLVCAMCGILEHKSHDLKPIEQAGGGHRDAIAAEVARTVVARDEVVAAKPGLEGVCDKVRQNGKEAKEKVILGFRRVMAEGKLRSEALIAKVDEAVQFKCGLLEAQVTGADESSDNATNGIELAEATLKVASPTQVLQYKKVLVGGLQRFQNHGLALEQACGPLVDVMLGDALDAIVTQIGTLGVLRTMDTDPAASTAAGEGLAVAKVGGIADFVITAVEFMSGNVRTTGGDKVRVMLVAAEGCGGGDGSGGGGGDDGGGGAAAGGGQQECVGGTAVDNGDGTYSCSYTPPEGADEVGGGKWRLEVLLNGKHIVGSPFAIEVHPRAFSVAETGGSDGALSPLAAQPETAAGAPLAFSFSTDVAQDNAFAADGGEEVEAPAAPASTGGRRTIKKGGRKGKKGGNAVKGSVAAPAEAPAGGDFGAAEGGVGDGNQSTNRVLSYDNDEAGSAQDAAAVPAPFASFSFGADTPADTSAGLFGAAPPADTSAGLFGDSGAPPMGGEFTQPGNGFGGSVLEWHGQDGGGGGYDWPDDA